jgi:hypothetical protein
LESPFPFPIFDAARRLGKASSLIGYGKMIVRKLMYGGLMFGAVAAFTFFLATAMQQHATVDVPSYQPGAPPAVAADKRSEQEWMF